MGYFHRFHIFRAHRCSNDFSSKSLFYTIFQVNGQILSFSPSQNVAFMVLKTTSTISRFQHKNWFVKGANIARVIDYNLFLADGLVWLAKSKNNFVYILGQIALFFKPIITLKPSIWPSQSISVE